MFTSFSLCFTIIKALYKSIYRKKDLRIISGDLFDLGKPRKTLGKPRKTLD